MSRSNIFPPSRLTKIVIHNFRHFKHVEVDLFDFTSINGKGQSGEALASLLEAIKFVLDCSELPLDQLKFIPNDGEASLDDENDRTLVEAHIRDCDQNDLKFCKFIADNEIIYTIDEDQQNQQDYFQALINTRIILQTPNTLVIDSKAIDKVASKTDSKRAAFIEFFCGSSEVVKDHEKLSNQLEKSAFVFNATKQQQIELLGEKKKLEKDYDSAEKRVELKNEIERQSKQLDLFKIYHNNQYLENNEEMEEETVTVLDELQENKTQRENILAENYKKQSKASQELEKLKIKLEKAISGCKKEQQLLFQSQTRSNDLETQKKFLESLVSFEDDMACREQELAELERLSEEDNEALLKDTQFQHLKKNFEKENGDELVELKSSSCIEDIARLKKSIENHARSNNSSKEKVAALKQEIENLEQLKAGKLSELSKIKENRENLKKLKTEIAELNDDINMTFSAPRPSLNQEILENLRKKFSSQIFGRLSDNFSPEEVENEVVRKLLGKFSNAILVNTRQTAEECCEILKFRQNSECFLILDELSHQQPTKTFLLNEKFPRNFTGSDIESLIKGNSENLEKAILFCLKPLLVCDTLAAAEGVLKLKSTKRVDVVSSEAVTCFRKQGFVERCGGGGSESVDGLLERRHSLKIKSLGLLGRNEDENIGMWQLEDEIAEIEEQISSKEEMTMFTTNCMKFDVKRIKDLQGASKDLVMDPLDMRKLEEFQEKQEKMFEEFLKTTNASSVEEYDEMRKRRAAAGTKLKLLKEEIAMLKDFKSLMSQIPEIEEQIDEEKTKQLKISTKRVEKEEKLNEILENVSTAEEKLEASVHETIASLKSTEKIMEEIAKYFKENSNKQIKSQMCLAENFEILTRNFKDLKELPVKTGRMTDFSVPPAKASQDYQLMKDQLKLIELDFQSLRKNLREVADVDVKSHELSSKLKKTLDEMETVGSNIEDEICEQRLNVIKENLLEINKKVAQMKTKMQDLEGKLVEVRRARKRTFQESVESINEGIAEFCTEAYGGKFKVSLTVTNNDEPYASDVQFIKKTGSNTQVECQGDRTASLAFLFGLLNSKNQPLVILNDVAKCLKTDLRNFLEKNKNQQIISFSTELRDNNHHYSIRRKMQSFSVARIT